MSAYAVEELTDWWSAGWQAGYDAGRRRAWAEIDQRYELMARHVLSAIDQPLYGDLVRRREEPGEIALDWRRRHGTEYRGGIVSWHRESGAYGTDASAVTHADRRQAPVAAVTAHTPTAPAAGTSRSVTSVTSVPTSCASPEGTS